MDILSSENFLSKHALRSLSFPIKKTSVILNISVALGESGQNLHAKYIKGYIFICEKKKILICPFVIEFTIYLAEDTYNYRREHILIEKH